MREADFCYEQSKKRESIPNWKNKRSSNFDQTRKCFKSNKSFGNNSRNFSKNNYQETYFKSKTQQKITAAKGRDMFLSPKINLFSQDEEFKSCYERFKDD